VSRGVLEVTALVSEAAPPSGAHAVRLQGLRVEVEARSGGATVARAEAGAGAATPVRLALPEPRAWTPEDPHLYELDVRLVDVASGQVVDRVSSYAGLRRVGRRRDSAGHLQFTLNGKLLFHFGALDQGWWPDGLLTPPSDEALLSDIVFQKAAGFNMIRKHVKVEPRRFYFHCDRLGMLVWQDHVSAGNGPRWSKLKAFPTHPRRDGSWSRVEHRQFMRELDAMVGQLESHPSIVVWTPFNEAWGQHRTLEVGRWLQWRDPSRMVNLASGGNFWRAGHIADAHAYPDPSFPDNSRRFDRYVKVVGEFGGHGWAVPGHSHGESAADGVAWGYGGLPPDLDGLRQRYNRSIAALVDLRIRGIAAGVYTQVSDVETEVNGLLTYDRAVAKMNASELRALHAQLVEPCWGEGSEFEVGVDFGGHDCMCTAGSDDGSGFRRSGVGGPEACAHLCWWSRAPFFSFDTSQASCWCKASDVGRRADAPTFASGRSRRPWCRELDAPPGDRVSTARGAGAPAAA